MRPLQIRLADETGKVYRWIIRLVPRAINCTLMQKTRVVSGWEFTDHEGYTRFSEGNWSNVVYSVKAVSENYGLTLLSNLS